MYEEGMRELEVMRACCGEDEEGFSRAAVSVKLMMLKEDETAEEIDEIVLDNPIVNIYRDPRRTLIDLTFPNVKDFEITNLAVRLQSFMGEKMTMQRDAVPSIMMTLAPKELFGQYFISAIHGMWFLMPSAVGGVIDTVRFIFENDFVDCFEVREDSRDTGPEGNGFSVFSEAEEADHERKTEEEGMDEDDYYV